MAAVGTYTRIDTVKAVQFNPGDVEAEQAIRGWTGLPVEQDISLIPGTWVVRRDEDGQLFLVPAEDFKLQFAAVMKTTSTDVD
jgi:hypothetical protein